MYRELFYSPAYGATLSRGILCKVFRAHCPKIYPAKDFNSNIQPVIFKVAQINKEAKRYWYVDNVYTGSTQTFHEMQITAETGIHYITVEDEFGNEIKRKIEIIKE